MKQVPAPLDGILCDPDTHTPISFVNGEYRAGGNKRIPIIDGFPSFLPEKRGFRERLWEWVYNRTAFGYDFGVKFGWRLPLGGAPIDRNDYLSRLISRPGMRLLETAVGTGDNILSLSAAIDYYALDQSLGMLRRCRKRLNKANRTACLVHADMQAIPFCSNSFDAVLHMGGLQFLSNPKRAVHEMHRTARPGAQVLIVEETASIHSILRRAGINEPEGLVPPSTESRRVQKISGGELTLIEFKK